MLPDTLPRPDAHALTHSETLVAKIHDEIARQGPICFARYMQLALYEPGLGYYSAGARKFGAGGDFITAPELSPLFSQCLAKQCQQILVELGGGDILEFGAGSGAMAADLLLALEALDCLPKYYFILEVSADLKQRQKMLLTQRAAHLLDRIVWLETLPTQTITGVILANEVMDAMPIHRFYWSNATIQEYYVTLDNDTLAWQLTTPCDDNLTTRVNQIQSYWADHEAHYSSEINLLLPAWIKSLSDILKKGLILLIDYGFPRHEFYHPDRNQGTLMCHYRHRAHDNPLFLPGLQDITAHVDFTAVAEAAVESGLAIAGFTTQAAFLFSCGLAEIAAISAYNSATQQWATANQIKQLTLPSEMGEFFKVIALTQSFATPLLGFTLQNMKHRL